MTSPIELSAVLAAYPSQYQPQAIQRLGSAGGFSGAHFWRLTTPVGTLCLRRWPSEHPQPERLEYIHAVLRHVFQQGFRRVPLPIRSCDERTFVRRGGNLWEVAPWLEGEADYHRNPRPAKLTAALEALAEFHLAASSYPHSPVKWMPSPAIAERRRRVADLRQGGADGLHRAVVRGNWPEMEVRARQLLEIFGTCAGQVWQSLEETARLQVPCQTCIRDIWHDHVLFRGDQVSGFVDFGAVRQESVSGDIARLLGSLIGDDPFAWQAGLEAYQRLRPLSEAERRLVRTFDRSTVLLGGLNWLEWIYLQRRQFEDRERILIRLDEIIARLVKICQC